MLSVETMNYAILPLSAAHFSGLHQVFDAACKQESFLFFLQAPPIEQTFRYYQNMVDRDYVYFVALCDETVVGWCDLLPQGDAAHVGVLSVALLPQAQGLGLGRALMQAALAKAWQQGFVRIELTVRVDNQKAQALYQQLGFVNEGAPQQDLCIRGQYFTTQTMVLLAHSVP